MPAPRSLIPQTPLVVCEGFGPGLEADRVGTALARGLARGGAAAADLCPLPGPAPRGHGAAARIAGVLADAAFDGRMRRSRAVIVAARALQPRTLAGSLAFEVATRARQSGVPCYAVAARNGLNSFDARVLDLQVVLQASGAAALTRAGSKLAGLI